LLSRAGRRTRLVLGSDELGIEFEMNGTYHWAGPGLSPERSSGT
jgi:hypothetical protein